jgi:hypothetical protein
MRFLRHAEMLADDDSCFVWYPPDEVLNVLQSSQNQLLGLLMVAWVVALLEQFSNAVEVQRTDQSPLNQATVLSA